MSNSKLIAARAKLTKMSKLRKERQLEWLKDCHPEEKALQRQALDFQMKYFADLRLLDRKIQSKLFAVTVNLDDGESFDTFEDPPEISVGSWIFRLRRFQGNLMGRCDSRKRLIEIRRDLETNCRAGVLLHELVHAFEGQLPFGAREWLLLELHKRVEKKSDPRNFASSSTRTRIRFSRLDRMEHFFS